MNELRPRPPTWLVYLEGDPDTDWGDTVKATDLIRGPQAEVGLLTAKARPRRGRSGQTKPGTVEARHLFRVMVIHWRYEVPMVKKLTKHGNSLALVIDRPILELLRIDPETLLDISTDGERLIVARAQTSARRKKFESAQDWAHRRYGRAFRKLAQ